MSCCGHYRNRESTFELLGFELPKPWSEEGLAIASVVCTALSLVPSARAPSALALRSVGVIAGGKTLGQQTSVVNAIRFGAATAGVVGLATANPMLLTASLVAEVAIQAFNVTTDFKNPNTPLSVGVMIVSAVALAAIRTSSWQLMTLASVGNAALLFGVAFVHGKNNRESLVFSNTALAVLNLVAALQTSALWHTKVVGRWLEVQGSPDADLRVMDAGGNDLGLVEAGGSVRFPRGTRVLQEARPYTTTTTAVTAVNGRLVPTFVPTTQIRYVPYLRGVRTDNNVALQLPVSRGVDTRLVIDKLPMDASQFSTLPVTAIRPMPEDD